jgi:arsenate reductase
MAEGLAKDILGDTFTILSAGSKPSFVHPMAIAVMAEINIDISQQFSKSVSTIDLSKMDKIITLCGDEACPIIPSKIEVDHWPLPDPAASCDGNEEQLDQFRKVRDILIGKIHGLKASLQNHFQESGEPSPC